MFSQERSGASGQPQFSCIFLLNGRESGGSAQVDTWSPGGDEHISGTLAFMKEGATLKLAEDHGGCGMTTGSMANEPYEIYREDDAATDCAGRPVTLKSLNPSKAFKHSGRRHASVVGPAIASLDFDKGAACADAAYSWRSYAV